MGEYIVSARKYRPMTFDSVVGQAALTATLKNAVKSGKLAHAYLQVHVKRGNVKRSVASRKPRRIAWALTPRGRAMLARTAP